MSDKKLTESVGNSNRLTDKEIIKALECCSNPKTRRGGCSFYGKGSLDTTCSMVLMGNAFDLINRQQAEIERLQYLLDEEEKKYTICAKHFYKEVIKEFAERLKTEIDIRPTHSKKQNEYVFFLIDNLVKEMVGDDNA